MTVKKCILVFFVLSALFTTVETNASPLPKKIKVAVPKPKPPVHVPPPVLRSFYEELEDIAADYYTTLADTTGSLVKWTKDKDEYTVSARIKFGICGKGGFDIFLTATFKANGKLIQERIAEAECTGLIDF